MKIKVLASELTETDIQMVSLVKHGANRSPFKIVKAEDETGSEPDSLTLGKKIAKAFGVEKKPQVMAFFIRKGTETIILPKLAEAGFAINCTEENGVIVAKQKGYADDKLKGLVNISDDLGVALDQDIAKACYLYETSDNFADNVNSQSFSPSLSQGIDALYTTIWRSLDSSYSQEDAAAKVDAALAAFRKYVNELVKVLPQSIFKFDEKNLRKDFGASTVSTTSEENVMKTAKLNEAVAGDLDGLNVQKTEAKKEEPAKAEAAAVEKKDEAAKTTEPAKADAAVVKTEEVKKEEAAPATEKKEVEDPLKVLATSVASLADAVAKSAESTNAAIAALTARVEKVEKKEEPAKAVEPTKEVSVVYKGDAALDQSLATMSSGNSLRGKEVKKTGDVWQGSALDVFERV